jgi:ATP-binding cassette, subfamily B, bacterial
MTQTHALLEECGMSNPRGTRGTLSERLALHPAAGIWRHFRETGMPGTAAAFLAAHAAAACVWVAIWQSTGRASLSGQLDIGWIWRWALLLASLAPLRFWAAWSQRRFSVGVVGLLKQSLAAGANRLPAGAVRALWGGLASLVSVVELALASAVLTMGASDGMLLAVFLAWALLAIAIAWRYTRARDRWTGACFGIAPDPNMHDDYALNQYCGTSARIDWWAVRLNSFGPNGWLFIGLLGLMPAFFEGASANGLAVGLGGVLLAYQALRSALRGVSNLIGAAVSWREAAPLDSKIPEGRDLTFRYRSKGPAALHRVRGAVGL